MHENYLAVERASWINYFLGLSFFVAERSEDAETRIGCILTDRSNHIIGTGYNSLPRGISQGLMPNTRKDNAKYPYMIHAEENAMLNTTLDPWTIPGGAVCYLSAKPCVRCLYRLHNKNISTIYYAETGYHFKDYDKEKENFDTFVNDVKIEVISVVPDLSWLNRPIDKISKFSQQQIQPMNFPANSFMDKSTCQLSTKMRLRKVFSISTVKNFLHKYF